MEVSSPPRKRPRIFYGWYIVGASVALNFYLSIAFFQGFQVFFLPILTEFGWSRALTSGAYSLRQLESGVLAPAIGFLVDRRGPRVVILGSVILAGIGMVLLSAVHSVWSFYLALLVVSAGTSGASHGISWPVAVSAWFRRLQGRSLGIAMLGPVAGGPFVFIVALMEQALGWRQTLLLLGVGVFILGIPLAMMVRSEPGRYGYQPDGDEPGGDQIPPPPTNPQIANAAPEGLTAGQAMRTRNFWILSLVLGLQFLGTSGVTVHLIPLLEGIQYTSTFAASLLGIIFLLSGIGRIGAGVISDMADHRTVIAGFLVCQIVALVVLATLGPAQNIQLMVFALLFGVGFGGLIPLRPFMIRRLFGARSYGAIQGLVQGVAVLTGVLGPLFYGRVFDVTGSYDLAIYLSIAVLVLGVPLAYALSLPRSTISGEVNGIIR